MTAAHFALFLVVSTLSSLTPGPAVLTIVSLALRAGLGAALRGVLGIVSGIGVYLVLAVLGLIALLTASPTAFAIVRYAGAVYLIWLGFRLLLAAWQGNGGVAIDSTASDRSAARAERPWLQGFLTQISNPKAMLYWTALLPQFIEPRAPVVPQIVLLGVAGAIVDSLVLAAYGLLAVGAREVLRGPRFTRGIDGIAGAFMFSAGVLLIYAARTRA